MKKSLKLQLTHFIKGIFCLLAFLVLPIYGFSQNAGISATGAKAPNPAAGLDVNFTTKGLLIPRVSLTGTINSAPLATHVKGMLVFNKDSVGDVRPGFYYNDGTKWILGFPKGIAAGNMQYWDGSNWKDITAGLPGQKLQLSASNVPTWVP
jgi:hypothetical protein